jgi:PHD-zinc-finger like domain
LTCKEHTLENRQTLVEQHNTNEMETVASASGLRGKTIADAIAVACGTFSFPSNEKNTEKILNSEGNRTSPKCFLKNERLIKNTIQSRQKHTVSKKRGSKAGVIIIASDSNGRAAKTPLITPPRFECLPALDSVIRVVCTMPGTLAPCYLPEIFALDAAASDLAKCSVCFLSSDNETVKTCLTCGVAVHLSCCFSKGVSLEEGNAWLCAVCISPEDGKLSSSRKRKSKTPRRYRDDTEEEEDPTHATDAGGSTKCQICGHYGGAMSPLDESNCAFVHEVCRIWTRMKSIATSKNPNETSNKSKFAMTCAICGVNECDANVKKFVRCVVAGCQVSFHPICGLLASKIASSEAVQSEMPLDTLERMKMLDTQLCMQYTLSMMKCTVGSARNSMTSALPIAFCGLHNPIRDISFFGCPPCANILGESMRIPEASIFVKKK